MTGIDMVAAAAGLCIALAAVCGMILIVRGARQSLAENRPSQKVNAWKRQAALAAQDAAALKRLRGIMSTGRIRKEMLDGTALIRNKIAACDGRRMTTDVMLEELISDSELLKYPYARMLSLVRTEERGRAIEEFAAAVGDREAKEYARMIVMLDELEPDDIYESIVAFQKSMKEERITEIKKRDEAVSDLLYLPVVFNLLLIFFNFLYVSYFVQQKDAISFFM